MTSSLSISNMYLFNKDEKLVNYKSINEILNDFVNTRMDYYDIRKKHMIKKMENYLKVLSNKYKYINELLEGTIDLRKKSVEINEMLKQKKYDKQENTYYYLIKMPMDSVNEAIESLKSEYEKVQKELEELKNKSIVSMYYEELKNRKMQF